MQVQLLPIPAQPSLLRGKPTLPLAMYDAGTIRVTLECLPSLRHPQHRTLYGAVLFLNGNLVYSEGSLVQLLAEGEVVSESPLSPFGGFLLDKVPAGSYKLVMHLPSISALIEQMTVR